MRLSVRAATLGLLAPLLLALAACGNRPAISSTPVPPASNSQAAAMAAFTPTSAIDCVSGTITLAGSTAIQPLVEAAAALYEARCPGSTIVVQGGGSGVGLNEVSQGTVQIGASDTSAEAPNLATLVDHRIAREGFALVTSKDIMVRNLSQAQAMNIFTCSTTNWKDVGGPDEPIVVLLRPLTSGTRTVFRNLVLQGAQECQTGTTLTEDSSEAVRLAVEQTIGSISVIGFAYFADPSAKTALNIVAYNGVSPTLANMRGGAYTITADAHLYTKGEPTGLVKAFLDYMLSDDVQQQVIPDLNFAPIR